MAKRSGYMKGSIAFLLLLMLPAIQLIAANRTATSSGDWSNILTWNGDPIPTAEDDVFINAGITVTVDVNAECASINMDASPTSSTITIVGLNSLTVSGLFTMEQPGGGDLATLDIGAGSVVLGSLLMEATSTPRNDIISISTGSLVVSGSATTGAAGCQFIISSTGTITFLGQTSGTPTLSTVSGSTIVFAGNTNQAVFPGTYNGTLSISGTGYKTLSAATIVNENLDLLEGTLENSSYLSLGDGSTITRSQGSLSSAPSFSGLVNLNYSGASSIITSYEMPVGSSVLNDLRVASGGVVQGGTPGAIVNILTDAFGNTNNWTGDIGRSNNQFTSSRTSYAGGSSREVIYTYGASSSTSYTASIYRMVSTAGYASVNISWKQFIDNYDADTYPYTIKLQSSSSSSGPWTDIYSYSPTGSADIGPEVQRINNWTTDVGGDFYVRFYIEGYTYGLDYWYFDDLVIDGQDPTVPSSVSVNGDLDLTNGAYSIDENTLVLAGTLSGSNAIIGGTSSSLEVSGVGSNLTLPSITGGLNDFTISRSNGVSLSDNLLVNGVLDLQSSNPSATQGALETGAFTLLMAETATTTGAGDVTGFVERTSFLSNKAYSFGNEFTNIIFAAGGTCPSSIKVSIEIGASPTWFTTAIQRVYDFVQTGGAGCNATISTHYLNSELNSLDESSIVHWTNGTPGPPVGLQSWGKSGNDTIDNWVTIANVEIENFPTTFGQLENTLAAPEPASYIWNGSISSDWNTAANWTPGSGTPTSISNIVIPDASTTNNDPQLPASASLNTLRMESGAILDGSALASLTLNGANGAWDNEGGTFNPSTSTVIFTNAAATMSGTTDFYNVTVADGANLTPGTDNHMRISNSLSLSTTGVLMGVQLHNTIEFNGGAQSIVVPNGSTTGFHNLILSGSGVKTLPASAIDIYGSLFIAGSASATANGVLTIIESLDIGVSSSLDLGAYTHMLGGDLSNSGTLTSSASSLVFDGTAEQVITNSSGLSLVDLDITNVDSSVILGAATNCTLSGNLTIDANAIFDLATNTISSLAGSVSNAGLIKTQNTTSSPFPKGITWGGEIEFNGSAAQTIVLGTYNDITVSNPYGLAASDDITINGLLDLAQANVSATTGLLDMGSYTVLFGPSSTSTGTGEVTGIMRRTTIIPDRTYTFGHEKTSINFPNVGTLPTELSVKLTLGAPPAWKTDGMDRIFDVSQVGGSGTQATLYSHYLDSELNGNAESDIVDFVYFSGTPLLVEYGRSANDEEENWLVISNVNVGVFASAFGFNEITFAEAGLTALTWNGSTSSSWVTATNWTPPGAPSEITAITVPDASTTNFNLEIPAVATCKSITLESGAVLNSSADGILSIDGDNLVWTNNGGTFNPGTGTIAFSGTDVSLSGINNFHNLLIEIGASVYLEDGAYLGITGDVTNLGLLGATENGTSTIEYKGADQIVAPTERLSNTYSTLLLSGSGTKTLPSVPMLINSEFTISGTAIAEADTAVSVTGDMTIGSGASYTTGTNRLTLMSNLINNGTLNGTGGNVYFSGAAAQELSGTSATTFDSLTINNPVGVSLNSDALTTVSGLLGINNGMILDLPAGKHLTVTGVLTNLSDSTGLVLHSDATGTASLIHNTAGVEATVERYMEADSWHIFSPSVLDQSAPGFLTNALNNIPTKTTVYGMMRYSESGGVWEYFDIPSTGSIDEGTGYLLRHTTDDAVSTYGALNSVSKDVTITRTNNGWNCIGNPFPSALGVREDASTSENFLTYNAASFDPSFASLYLWDEPETQEAGVDYYKVISNAGFTPSRPVLDMAYMQPGQGFIVKSATGGGTMSFTTNMRVHENTPSYVKSKRVSWPGIILSVSSGSMSATTSITFNGNMTPGLDVTYDAGLMGGNRAFRIYSRLIEDNGVNFMLQCLPDYDFEEMIIPIGFDCSDTGTVSFTAELFDLPVGCGAFIEDRKREFITDLQGGASYTVRMDSVQQGIGRFFLHLSNNETGLDQKRGSSLLTYCFNREIVIKGEVGPQAKAALIDISGRVLQVYDLQNSHYNTIPVGGFVKGIYLLDIYGKEIHHNARLLIE